ncbi:MAG: RNA repair transcriptional activator RtcR [Thermoanaerobaculia bacterium]
MRRKQVLIGLLGPTLDRGTQAARWGAWRPTVSLFQHEDLLFDRLELLYQQRFQVLTDQICEDVRSISPETDVRTNQVEMKDAWDFEEVYAALHDFARAYPFDVEKEEYFVHITTGTHVAQICLFLLTEARYFPARLIQTAPPTRKSDARHGSFQLIDLDVSRYDRIAARFHKEKKESLTFLKSGIATRSHRFNELIERIERVAIASKAPMLVLGPTGAGKSLLARRVYELKKARRQLAGPFVDVNCATLRGDGAMSALFGHEKGAFTGAVDRRAGLLRSADGGLLFLDEVGELGLDEQAMLLRALEEKRFLPVGSDKEAKSDFQLIAGTNRDLQLDVRDGRFREDLFARMNLWTFRLPSLRERAEDIEPNLEYELEQFATRNGVLARFNKEARQRFLKFATSGDAVWAANFRDLNGAVTRMATLCTGGRIGVEDVDQEIERLRAQWRDQTDDDSLGPDESLSTVLGSRSTDLDRFDAAQLADVIRVCRGSRSLSDAGRTLFAVSRAKKQAPNDADRLRKYLTRFGLEWRQVIES